MTAASLSRITDERELAAITSSPALTANWAIPDFIVAKHVEAIDEYLLALANREITRLLITMPPRHSKSTMSSRVFPGWYLGWFPDHCVMCFTAIDEMTKRSAKSGRELAELVLPGLFGLELDPAYGSAYHWKIANSGTDKGECLFSSIGAGRTMGAGANLLIIDDYFRNVEDAMSETKRVHQMEWLLTSAMTRLHPGGVALITGTRWHKDDIIGVCQRGHEEKWEILDLPAIAEEDDQIGRQPGEALFPHKWPAERLHDVKRRYESTGYPWMWEALYQQHPPLTLDAEWPTEYFEDVYFEHWPKDEQLQFKVLALDPSLGKTDTADFSAFVVAGLGWDGTIYVEADVNRRDAFTMIRDGIGLCRQRRCAAWAIEANAFQDILNPIIIAMTSAEGFAVPVHSITNVMEKITRIRMRLTPLLAMRKLRFKSYSPGTALLLEQMQGFPNHSFDDGPDALELACKLIDDVYHRGDADIDVEPYEPPQPSWATPRQPMVT